MLELSATVKPGVCEVYTTEHRGFTPEEIAERAVPKIVFVAESADPEVREQAETFKNRLFHVIVKACNDAIESDRTTLANLFTQQGHEDMADILRRL
jgi:cephalosporin hydroxylase|tara:strand:+ start:884 stop:1174 length:291 start_codon:yes stop_codon:yes gene_type:complete